jgi:16S rRNA (cytosine1402-N4)-methyltransferase
MRTQRLASSSDPVSEKNIEQRRPAVHQSVLLHEVIELLSIQESEVVVDGTVGGAGHSKALVAHLGPDGTFIGLDADSDAIERARDVLPDTRARIELCVANFRSLESVLAELKIPQVNKVLLDLGWSSFQLDVGRGFSFMNDEPLSMTYGDPTQALFTAETVVNEWEEEHIADILKGWGEERFARRIAAAIVAARSLGRIKTSGQLAEIIAQAVPTGRPSRGKRIHPATRTFQALRIAVNDELGALTEILETLRTHLAPGGRVAIISFHSIEDRLVKQTFAAWKREGLGAPVTKKPVVPSTEELGENPRARSAKLRVFERAL